MSYSLRPLAEKIYLDTVAYWDHVELASEGEFPTVEHAQRKNKEEGGYWYSDENMRAFRTRSLEVISGRVLVWSDIDYEGFREYKVAPLTKNGSPRTSLNYSTQSLDSARRVGRHLVQILREHDDPNGPRIDVTKH